MKLLVGSVYIDHPRSHAWYDLQMKYLNLTTDNFEHIVCTGGRDDLYRRSKVIKIQSKPGQPGHILGLNTIIHHFNRHTEYDHLLLLDSDCFPIQNLWQYNLDKAMGDFDVAAVVRYENLDTFAHPCVFYVRRQAAKNLNFAMLKQTNLVGFPYEDTSSNVTRFFPLIRSNTVNYHPILFGVYWDCFYHHGAGSRNLSFRLFYSYYNKDKNVSAMEEEKFKELVKNSDKFIDGISSLSLSKRSIKLC